jgi:tetratricopeptide (TPR) repeat protein
MLSKRFLILLIIISPVSICNAQSASDAFLMAKRWYEERNYSQAILEAKRALFFDDLIRLPGYMLLSDCYVQMELYDDAIKFLSLAAEVELNDSLKNELLFRKINLYLRNKEPAYALIELQKVNDIRSVYFAAKRDFYSALAYYQIDDFRLSEAYTNKLLRSSGEYDSCYVSTFFRKARRNYSRSSVYPSVLSAVLPGAGQLSEGYFGEAANSLLLNALLGCITYITFKQVHALDAILTMYPLVRRYYLSGIFKAGELSNQKKERRKIELYNELLDFIDHQINN